MFACYINKNGIFMTYHWIFGQSKKFGAETTYPLGTHQLPSVVCLIYIICVCLRTVVSSTYCVVFLCGLYLSLDCPLCCVYLSLDCPFCNVYFPLGCICLQIVHSVTFIFPSLYLSLDCPLCNVYFPLGCLCLWILHSVTFIFPSVVSVSGLSIM